MNFCWVTIKVQNMYRSLMFYQDIVGLSLNQHFHAGGGMEIAFLGSGETQVELIKDENSEPFMENYGVSLGFQVSSLDDMMHAVDEKGVKIHSGPFFPNPSVGFFYVQDPDGFMIQFVEKKTASK